MKNDYFKRLVSSSFEACADDYEGLSCMHTPIEHIPDIKMATDTFVSMANGEYDFYGIDHNAIKLNDMIFEILEDPNDGYRSYLGAVRIADGDTQYTFFRIPIAKVRIKPIEDDNDFTGYYIIDIKDKHMWGRIGTYYVDDYYPSFACNYYPKEAFG